MNNKISRVSLTLGTATAIGVVLALGTYAMAATGTMPAAKPAQAQPLRLAQADEDGDGPPAGGRGGRGAAAGGAGAAAAPPPFPTGITIAGTVPSTYRPVTEAMMENPSDNDWLMKYRNYAGWSHSPLKQITAANVKNLQLKWSWAVDDGERQQITPLVHDGVMFISVNFTNRVQALDAKTGDIIWESTVGPRLARTTNATRSMALYGDQIFYPATEGTLYALDARTGKVNWKVKIAQLPRDNIGGMMVADGKVVLGLGRCDQPVKEDRCFIAAYDTATGKEVWKFYTVAYSTDKVGGNSWGKMEDGTRAGADAWIAGTYDPKLKLTYWGTGQAKGGVKRGIGDVLFSNSTVALDINTGALKWYWQDAPDETLDLDEVFEKVLVDYGTGPGQQVALSVGKKGILWKVDRTNGKFIGYVPAVFQNAYTKIDPKTGRGTYRADITVPGSSAPRNSCPSAAGGKDWQPMSYVPSMDMIVIPLMQICDMQGNYEAPGSDGFIGRISAYETKTLKPLWTFQQRAPFLTSTTTTAGGIGFVGDWDRTVRAFDLKNGNNIWSTRLATTAQGTISTYAVDGDQYVAVATGYNGGSPEARPNTILALEKYRPTSGHGVYVFGLPK